MLSKIIDFLVAALLTLLCAFGVAAWVFYSHHSA
ncbi:MAG: hypothetical protein RL260_1728 [Pseudomonadota bacterium]|jgi:hypothetical protein